MNNNTKKLNVTSTQINELAAAVLIQAIRDFAVVYRSGHKAEQNHIIKDLKSTWMDWFTNGKSLLLAEGLEKNPEAIISRTPQLEDFDI